MNIGDKVISTEHMKAIGEVIRINEDGAATIEFVTPVQPNLPYGHRITEFWTVSDQSNLIVIE